MRTFGLLYLGLTAVCAGITPNDRPIIGILAQDYYGKSGYGKSYIAASYVKYLESAGARVIPVFVNQTLDYYMKVVNYTNGILFPGGNNYAYNSSYGTAGKILYKLAVLANDRGDYYPLWGSCLGFELLTYLSSGNKWWMSRCNAEDMPLPLEFLKGSEKSKILKNMPSDVKGYISTLPVTINYHNNCISPKNFTKSGLNKFYKVLSTNQDFQNTTFVSTIEGIKYPFYGVAWHPEKNQFEFIMKKNRNKTPHGYPAVRVGQYFANFFVNEARMSSHRFPNPATEQNSLIYNYQAVYTSPMGSSFEQCYFFN